MPVRPRDEGPSAEDLDRFGSEDAYCPDCGAKIWDQADVCPSCYAYLGGDTSRHRPFERWWKRRWTILVVATLVGVLVGLAALLFRHR